MESTNSKMESTNSKMESTNSKQLVFFVNGKKVTESNPDPDVTLLVYLRDTLLLKGAKQACGAGGCGACTVMLSYYDRTANKTINRAVTSCLLPVCAVHGCAVTTVEGIGSIRSELHPIQARLVEGHGLQCGFCTPGMVMSMYALLRNNPTPSRNHIENALGGNLCRCTGYRSILQAVDSFSQEFACGMGDMCCKNKKGEVEVTQAGPQPGNAYQPYDPSQDVIFPSQLQLSDELDKQNLEFKGMYTTWLRPTSLDNFLEQLRNNPDMTIVGGFVQSGLQLRQSPGVEHVLLSVSGLREVHLIQEDAAFGVAFGAGLTITDTLDALKTIMEKHPDYATRPFTAVHELLKQVASEQIRNIITLGGSLNASHASSDVITALLGVGAHVMTASTSSSCITGPFPLDDLCIDGKYKPVSDGSVLLEILIFFTGQDSHIFTFRQAERHSMARAVVNACLSVQFVKGTNTVDWAKLCFGGIGSSAILAQCASHMEGKLWDENLLESTSLKLNEELASMMNKDENYYVRSLALGFLFSFFHAVRQQLQCQENKWRTGEVEEPSKAAPVPTACCPTSPSQPFTQVWEETPPDQPELDTIGRPHQLFSGRQMATGQAMYYSDLPRREDELVIALVRGTRPHAHIVSVDTSAALAAPGVVGYVGHEDVPGHNKCGVVIKDEVIFAIDKVEWVGQVIGAIVAHTEQQARYAAKQVNITYQDIAPVILTIQEAIAAGSFYPDSEFEQQRGDLEAGFKDADYVKEGTVRIGGQLHFYMETQFAYVVPVGTEDEYDLYLGTQSLTDCLENAAETLNLPSSKIAIHQKRVGGGFGGKETKSAEVMRPVLVAAHKFQRPVRLYMPRDEDLATTGGRHPYLVKYKVGFKKDGKLTAIEFDSFNNGGHSYDLSFMVGLASVYASENAYRCPAIRSKSTVCKTNTPSNTAMRGFGHPQINFAMEQVMDHIAHTLKLPNEQVRNVNLLAKGDPLLTHIADGGNVRRCWDELALRCDINAKRLYQQEHNKNNRYKKRGLAVTPSVFGIGFVFPDWWQGGAQVLVYKDGSVLLAHGGVEMGQGINTKMIQIASRELGIATDRIHIREAGTNTVPNTITTAGSTGTDLNGPAVMNACRKLKKRLEPFIKANAEGTWDDWVSAAHKARISLSATGFYSASANEIANWTPALYYTCGVACTEVQLDCLTGEHVVLQTDIVMDVGRSLNPGIDIGQIEGAFVMGQGLHTMEEIVHGADGSVISNNVESYKIPSVKDIPKQFNVTLLKGGHEPRPTYSSKGVGEPPLGLGMSVFYAIKDAVNFARRDAGMSEYYQIDSPATVERVRMACTDSITEQVTGSSEYARPDWKA